jgi:isoleucyl-tRNA synthetase
VFDCCSALAEAEVEYEGKTSPAIDVASGCPTPQTRKTHGAAADAMAPTDVVIDTTPDAAGQRGRGAASRF